MAALLEKDSILQYLSIVVAGILCTMGLTTNSFIVTVNVADLLQGRRISATDKILSTLGIARIVFHAASFSYAILTTFFKEFLSSSPVRYVVDVAEVFCTQFSFCLTSLLSVVFCLKVSNFHADLLRQMKRFVLRRVPRLIVVSLLFSIGYASVQTWEDEFVTPRHAARNVSAGDVEDFTVNVAFLLIFVLGNMLPLLVYCVASAFLVVSLCRHIYRIRANNSFILQTEAYYAAVRFLAVSFLYYAVHSVAAQTVVYYYYFYKMDSILFYALVDSIPLLKSVYLMWATAKLRNAMSRILRRTAKFIQNRRKGPKSRKSLKTIAL